MYLFLKIHFPWAEKGAHDKKVIGPAGPLNRQPVGLSPTLTLAYTTLPPLLPPCPTSLTLSLTSTASSSLPPRHPQIRRRHPQIRSLLYLPSPPPLRAPQR
jgi:hypothetical protein